MSRPSTLAGSEPPAVDLGELVDGYQFDGRARAIEQWKERKEAREFEAFCIRLRQRKWRMGVRAEGGERLERLRASRARWRAKHRAKGTAAQNARKRAERLANVRGKVVTCSVEGCGTQWCPLPKRGKPRLYCSRACKCKAYRSRPGAA